MRIFQVIRADTDGYTSVWTPVMSSEAALAQINEHISEWNQQIEQSGDPAELEFRIPLVEKLLRIDDEGLYLGEMEDIIEFRHQLEMFYSQSEGTGYAFGDGEIFIVIAHEMED